jgi:hypothetical protein
VPPSASAQQEAAGQDQDGPAQQEEGPHGGGPQVLIGVHRRRRSVAGAGIERRHPRRFRQRRQPRLQRLDPPLQVADDRAQLLQVAIAHQ